MVINTIKGFFANQKKKLDLRKKEEQDQQMFQENEESRQAEALKKEADRLAQLKQYKTAVEEYKKALEIYPFKGNEENLYKNAKEFLFKTHFNVAACYTYMDLFDDAIQSFDNALKIDVEDAQNKVKALMAKGSCYYRKKRFLDGSYKGSYAINLELEKDEKKVKKDDKKDYVALAHKCFMEAADLDRSNPDAWYDKGHMEFLMGKIKDAVNSFDQVLTIKKTYDNRENIPLFIELKREKGLAVKATEILDLENSERKFKTKSGHFVRNKAEHTIADFLFDHNLIFQYDVAVSWSDIEDHRPTFYAPKLDLYIDHFQTDDLKQSPKQLKAKAKQFDKHKKHHIYTTTNDEKNLEEALRLKLKPYIII